MPCPLPLLGDSVLQVGKLIGLLLPAFLPALQAQFIACPGVAELLFPGIGTGQKFLAFGQFLPGAFQFPVPAAAGLTDLLQTAVGLLQQRLAGRSGKPRIVDLFIDGRAPEFERFHRSIQLRQPCFVLLGTGGFLSQMAADLLPGLFQSSDALLHPGSSSLVGIGVLQPLPVFGLQSGDALPAVGNVVFPHRLI